MHRSGVGRAAAFLLLVLGCMFKPVTVSAVQVLRVAVAANFAPAMEEMARLMTAETGIPVEMIVSSTGRLHAQIKNRAPYDLFFAADSLSPDRLFREGSCREPIRYATGSVVLWSRNSETCSSGSWQDAVTGDRVQKIAIANPETAPYGSVARETLEKKHLAAVSSKLVYASNVGQSFQYAAIGAVDAAFVARSYAQSEEGRKGCFLVIPEARAVEQKACATAYGRNRGNAERFLAFILSDQAASIREQFGYGR